MPYNFKGSVDVKKNLTAQRTTPSVANAIPAWVTGVDYVIGDIISSGGIIYEANAAHTAGATFGGDVANWDALSNAAVPATLIDSSAGVVADTLPAATGSGAIVFYANSDVASNLASVTVQAGEVLNGVTDALFFFSNYADGTQFIATDVATGQWVIAVEGASNSTSLAYVHVNDSTNTGGGTVETGITNGTVTYGVAAQVDTDLAFNNTTGEFTAPNTGKYYVSSIISFSNQSAQSDDSFSLYIQVDGANVYHQAVDPMAYAGDNEEAQVMIDGIVDVTAGQTIRIQLADISDGQDCASKSLTISQLPTQESVLAGMVTPTGLENGITTLSAAHDIAATGGITDLEDVPGMTISIPSAGRWRIEASVVSSSADASDDGRGVAIAITDSSNVIVNDGGIIPCHFGHDNTAADNTVDEKGSAFAVAYVTTSGSETFKLRASQSSNVPANIVDAATLRYEQLPTSSIVNPDGLVPEDLEHITVYHDTPSTTSTLDGGVNKVQFNNADFSIGSLAFADSKVTLKAGNTYRLDFFGRFSTGESIEFYDFTGAQNITDSNFQANSANDMAGSISAMFTPSVDSEVGIITGSASATSNPTPRFSVQQLSTKTVTALNPAFTEAKDLVSGYVAATADESFTTAAWVDHSELQLTLPNVGRYRIDADIMGRHSAAGNLWKIRLVDSSDNLLGDARSNVNTGTANNIMQQVTSAIVTTTSENEVVKLQVWGNTSTATITGNSDTAQGTSKLSYQQLPSTEYVTPGDVPVEDLTYAQVLGFSGNGQTALFTVTSTPGDANDAENLMDATARVPLTSAGWTGATIDQTTASGVTVGALDLTATQAGRYLVQANVPINGTDGKAIQIVKNGTTIAGLSTQYGTDTSGSSQTAHCYVDLTVGDTVDVRIANQNTGTPASSLVAVSMQQVATKTITALNPAFTEAKDLHRAAGWFNGAAGATIGDPGLGVAIDLADVDWVFYDPNSLISTGTDSVVISQDGVYDISFGGGNSTPSNSQLEIWIDGVRTAAKRHYGSGSFINQGEVNWSGVLTVGQVITFRLGINSYVMTDPHFRITQLPSTEYVTPGDVPVEDLDIFENNSITDGQTTSSTTYVDVTNGSVTLANIGKYLITYYATASNDTGGQGGIFRLVDSSDVEIPDSLTRAGSAANGSRFSASQSVIIDTVAAGEVYKLQWETTNSGTLTLYNDEGPSQATTKIVVTQLSSKTVIRPEDLVTNDQAASGYMDIGTMRMQWGVSTSTNGAVATISFPQPFGAAGASITGNIATASAARIVSFDSVTTTSFDVGVYQPSSFALEAHDFSWQAIGLKP